MENKGKKILKAMIERREQLFSAAKKEASRERPFTWLVNVLVLKVVEIDRLIDEVEKILSEN